MAVFIGASDETGGANLTAPFIYGGFVSHSDAWINQFIGPWQKDVLGGPPELPYFHFKEWRYCPWISGKHGVTSEQAEKRIDRAVEIILSMKQNIFWVTQRQPQDAHHTHIKPVLDELKIHDKTLRAQLTEPDFDATMGYLTNALDWAHEYWPTCTKIDFCIARKGDLTDLLIPEWKKIRTIFKDHEDSHRSLLFGELVPFDLSEDNPTTNYLPIQAADVMLWLLQREAAGTIEPRDLDRLTRLKAIEGLDHTKPAEAAIDRAAADEDLLDQARVLERHAGLSPHRQREAEVLQGEIHREADIVAAVEDQRDRRIECIRVRLPAVGHGR